MIENQPTDFDPSLNTKGSTLLGPFLSSWLTIWSTMIGLFTMSLWLTKGSTLPGLSSLYDYPMDRPSKARLHIFDFPMDWPLWFLDTWLPFNIRWFLIYHMEGNFFDFHLSTRDNHQPYVSYVSINIVFIFQYTLLPPVRNIWYISFNYSHTNDQYCFI